MWDEQIVHQNGIISGLEEDIKALEKKLRERELAIQGKDDVIG